MSAAIHQRRPCTANLAVGNAGAAVFISELFKQSSLENFAQNQSRCLIHTSLQRGDKPAAAETRPSGRVQNSEFTGTLPVGRISAPVYQGPHEMIEPFGFFPKTVETVR
jgi:hypothetical protein